MPNVKHFNINNQEYDIAIDPMTGATSSANGASGAVPAPAIADREKFLKGNGTWAEIPASGHTIVNSSGTEMTQRSKLKFSNATITDDSENDQTVIEVQGGGGTTIIQKPTVTVGTYTYNGTAQGPTITWSTGADNNCIVTNATKTNAGTYTLTIALKNAATMVWNDLTTADMTYEYTIAKADQNVSLSSNSVTLDPDHLSATVTVTGAVGTISVTSSDSTVATASLSGSTITIDSVDDKSGSVTVTVSVAGTDNYNTATDSTISVTASFSNFLEDWLTAGGLNPASYADLSAVLADEKAVRKLFTLHDSVDYLVANASNSNIATIINNDYCAKWINLRDYALDTLYANATIAALMDTADKYFYGEWTITDSTTTPVTWGPKGNVPVMTSNTAPYGTIIYNTVYQYSAPSRAFNPEWIQSSRWEGWTPSSDSNSNYIGYQFVNPICVKRVKLITWYSGESAITVKIQGSNNNSTWVDLDTITTIPGSSSIKSLENSDYYCYYRLIGSFKYSNTWGYSLQFYGRELKEESTSQPTDGRIYKYLNSKYYTENWGEYDWDEDNPRHYIYDHGVELETIGIRNASATFYNDPDCLHFSQSNANGKNQFYTTQLIDLTPYNYLRVHTDKYLKDVNYGDFGNIVVSTQNGESAISVAKVSPNNVPHNIILDISANNSSYELWIGMGSGVKYSVEISINEWWLE